MHGRLFWPNYFNTDWTCIASAIYPFLLFSLCNSCVYRRQYPCSQHSWIEMVRHTRKMVAERARRRKWNNNDEYTWCARTNAPLWPKNINAFIPKISSMCGMRSRVDFFLLSHLEFNLPLPHHRRTDGNRFRECIGSTIAACRLVTSQQQENGKKSKQFSKITEIRLQIKGWNYEYWVGWKLISVNSSSMQPFTRDESLYRLDIEWRRSASSKSSTKTSISIDWKWQRCKWDEPSCLMVFGWLKKDFIWLIAVIGESIFTQFSMWISYFIRGQQWVVGLLFASIDSDCVRARYYVIVAPSSIQSAAITVAANKTLWLKRFMWWMFSIQHEFSGALVSKRFQCEWKFQNDCHTDLHFNATTISLYIRYK